MYSASRGVCISFLLDDWFYSMRYRRFKSVTRHSDNVVCRNRFFRTVSSWRTFLSRFLGLRAYNKFRRKATCKSVNVFSLSGERRSKSSKNLKFEDNIIGFVCNRFPMENDWARSQCCPHVEGGQLLRSVRWSELKGKINPPRHFYSLIYYTATWVFYFKQL